jgi:hypothetical protein
MNLLSLLLTLGATSVWLLVGFVIGVNVGRKRALGTVRAAIDCCMEQIVKRQQLAVMQQRKQQQLARTQAGVWFNTRAPFNFNEEYDA